ncbi:S8 family serine peptidase [Lewinella sp. 4G2]|uniref:S8 family serine peptidase n=1 Tax=Lewinella sp. 4G2 TaxID=1803372 RepID=UPI0007B4656B|nr:S8 family serine peptidase [Lewinella sp. 4G2]OAV46176.1 hypothetical protein A3850_018120 [Lewinella sp. 4G2]
MTFFKKSITLICLVLLASTLSGQSFSDDFAADLSNWPVTAGWQWDADGKADNIPNVNWNNRSRLRSASEGGAALYDSSTGAGRLTSRIFTPDTEPGLFVSFYHYFQNQGGQIRLQVIESGGNVLYDEPLVPNVVSDEETSAGNFQIIDLSFLKTNGLNDFQISFEVATNIEFWLLDDVTVGTDRPAWPTFPIYFGQQLTNFGIPFNVDSLAMPFVPFEVVLDFAATATPAIRDAIRAEFDIVSVESCVCDRLEVWTMGGGVFFDEATGQPLGPPGDILERVLGSSTNSGAESGEVDNIELNVLTYDELLSNPNAPTSPLQSGDLAFLTDAPAGAVKVAVLDTGLDLDHPTLQPYLYKNDDPLGDGEDDDSNCQTDDLIGWNFVDGNNNPDDGHGHGTHVAGIVAQTVSECDNCTVQIMPYKTHDNFGVGTVFNAACAVLQASVYDEADVINASWGFYGQGSDILRRAIDTAAVYGALVVAAVGNDSLNMVADDQFPATYTSNTVMSVAAFDFDGVSELSLAPYSNYNPSFADISYYGTAINSALPGGGLGNKTGTSMATPALSATAALHLCMTPSLSAAALRTEILNNAYDNSAELGTFIFNGRIPDIEDVCEMTDPGNDGTAAPYSACICDDEQPSVVSVTADSPEGEYTIRVLTLSGEELNRVDNAPLEAGQPLNVELGTDEPGTYLIVIKNDLETRVLRVVRQD